MHACRHIGVTQNYKPGLLPHKHRTKLQAYNHTGVIQDYKLAAHNCNQQNYKLSATQATQLTAGCHTGILNWYCILAIPLAKLKNYVLTASVARMVKLHKCTQTGNNAAHNRIHRDKQYFSRYKGRTKCKPKLKPKLLKAHKPERGKPE